MSDPVSLGLIELISKFWYGVLLPIGYWAFRVERRIGDLQHDSKGMDENFKEYREDLKEIRTDIKEILSKLGTKDT